MWTATPWIVLDVRSRINRLRFEYSDSEGRGFGFPLSREAPSADSSVSAAGGIVLEVERKQAIDAVAERIAALWDWKRRVALFVEPLLDPAPGGSDRADAAEAEFLRRFIAELDQQKIRARRFAVDVSKSLVQGLTVWHAMLEFRRDLVRHLNPLGLVFTAYGFADLAVPRESLPPSAH